ncbi:MAG: DHHA1 domain-containing protein [bacterium]|nr:DHHA1 domain-containing protein [bacterium]
MKKYTKADLVKAQKLINGAKSILILAPDSQDGDSASANLALKTTFESMKKHVFWVSEKGAHPSFDYLEGNQSCADRRALRTLQDKIDLVVLADLGGTTQIAKSLESAPWILNKPKIIFDHHQNRNKVLFNVEIADESAAATGLLLAEIYPKLGWPITSKIATYMLAGIYSDTGSFTNLNTSQRVFEVSANLAKLGADPAKLSENFLTSNGMNKAELASFAKLLTKVKIKNHVAYAAINYSDIAGLTNSDMSHRVGDIIRYMQTVKVSFVVTEKMPKKFFLSMRCLDGFDVSKIAEAFGGGGHKVAAGAKFDESYSSIDQAIETVLRPTISEANKN